MHVRRYRIVTINDMRKENRLRMFTRLGELKLNLVNTKLNARYDMTKAKQNGIKFKCHNYYSRKIIHIKGEYSELIMQVEEPQ